MLQLLYVTASLCYSFFMLQLLYVTASICYSFYMLQLLYVTASISSPGHNNGYLRPSLDMLDSPGVRRRSRHVAKLNMGEAKDDIHVCIMCLRAIMNNKVMKDFCDNLIAEVSETCLLYFCTLVVCFRIIMFTVCVVGSCVCLFYCSLMRILQKHILFRVLYM